MRHFPPNFKNYCFFHITHWTISYISHRTLFTLAILLYIVALNRKSFKKPMIYKYQQWTLQFWSSRVITMMGHYEQQNIPSTWYNLTHLGTTASPHVSDVFIPCILCVNECVNQIKRVIKMDQISLFQEADHLQFLPKCLKTVIRTASHILLFVMIKSSNGMAVLFT